MTRAERRQLGIGLFDATWDLIDKRDRTRAEEFEMMHAAHASAYHWLKGGGEPLNEARSQWRLSRVYALLGMGESALVHGRRLLALCLENNIAGFDLAFGYEAVARAHAALGNEAEKAEHAAAGLAACADIPDASERAYCEGELGGIG